MQAPREDAQGSHGSRTAAEFSAENPDASTVETHEGTHGLSSREEEDPVPPETLLDKVTDCEGQVSEGRESSEELQVSKQEANDLGTERPPRQVAAASSSARSLSALDCEREDISNLPARGVANSFGLENPKRELVMIFAMAPRSAVERIIRRARRDGMPEAQRLLDMLATELKAMRKRSRGFESEDDSEQEVEDLDWHARLLAAVDA